VLAYYKHARERDEEKVEQIMILLLLLVQIIQ
jgi:hypothetical protein